MNEKRTALLTVCLLGAFLLTFSLWAYLKPDGAFSQSERRKLTPKPRCTVESIYSGRYMSDFETYAPDQFPLREQFRTLKSLTSLYLLRQRDTNGVYLAEGYVSRLEYPMQEDSIAHAARRFDYLYDTYLSGTNCRLYLSVIPDKNAFLASSHGYPALDYGAFTQSLREKTPYLTYLPIGDLLSLEDYYRTDLHWRQEQLTDVAARLLEGMGAEAPGTFREETLPTPYYGVYYGYAALPMEPDTIRYLTNDTLESCTVYHYETGQTTGHLRWGEGCRAGPLRVVPLRLRVPADGGKSPCCHGPGACDLPGLLRQQSGPPSGGAVCQDHAGGHPIPFQHNAWKVSYLYRSGCAVSV